MPEPESIQIARLEERLGMATSALDRLIESVDRLVERVDILERARDRAEGGWKGIVAAGGLGASFGGFIATWLPHISFH